MMGGQSVDISAGLGGFLAFFLLAVALYLLMRNMNARMRRMAYREELEAKAAEDAQSAERADPEQVDGPDSPAADDDSRPGGP